MLPYLCHWDGKNASELKATGEQFLRYFVNVCGLKPNARVLDVGCGIGRIAAALTGYLNTPGSYEGLDLIPEAIEWCKRRITSKYPNFHFQFANVVNKDYNPNGTVNAAQLTFPYDDSSFDFVFLGSVFTHMLPAEIERYLFEIARVLKEDGKALVTYFLLSPEAIRHIDRGDSTLRLEYAGERFKAASEAVPEAAIAYDEMYVKELYANNNLIITDPIRYGTWSYHLSDFEYQDFIVAEKHSSN